ncbi:MAG: DUF3597 domain-containing protein [Terrimicrobiaceae bacterium]
MGLFANLLSKVFGHQTAATSPQSAGTAEPAAAGGPAPATVDVTAILDDLASKNPEKLDWRKSIVDLMKLVGMDSSLAARKELAKDLSYTGDTSDSATMNIWLHKVVIKKIAENGGKVPNELLA